MPAPRNPEVTDHFVYVCHSKGYPFYVGHGHAGRLSDRARFIDSLVRLHPDRSYHKWQLHGCVTADLWEAGAQVYFDQITTGQKKHEAASEEAILTAQLLREGFLLANKAGNPGARHCAEIVEAILSGSQQWQFLTAGYRPVNRYTRPL